MSEISNRNFCQGSQPYVKTYHNMLIAKSSSAVSKGFFWQKIQLLISWRSGYLLHLEVSVDELDVLGGFTSDICLRDMCRMGPNPVTSRRLPGNNPKQAMKCPAGKFQIVNASPLMVFTSKSISEAFDWSVGRAFVRSPNSADLRHCSVYACKSSGDSMLYFRS